MGTGSNSFVMQLGILVAFILLMYFLLIRPQKKKEKEVKEMRDAVRVGDEIITIGGICGKVVKTKDETLVIQVGADRTKFEVMRWSISSVTSRSKKAGASAAADTEEDDQPQRRNSPRRLKKSTKPAEEAAEDAKTEVKEAAADVKEAAADVKEAVEEAPEAEESK